MEVLLLDRSHDAESTAFLDELGDREHCVLGYHYPFYRDMLVHIGVGEPVYLGARLGGELVGLLPAFSKVSGIGRVFCSLPFFGPNAGVLCRSEGACVEVHRVLLGALLDMAKQGNTLSCTAYTPFGFDEFGLYDAVLPDALVASKFTQYVELGRMARNSSIGRHLRRAARMGMEITDEVTADRIEEFYSIYEANCGEYGIPLKPKSCVTFLAGEGLRGGRVSTYFAYHSGEMIGGLMMIWSRSTASYYIPCARADARTLQPVTVLIDRAMQDAQGRGIRVWNWESSPSREDGVYRFKKKWGSVEGQYRVYVKPFRDLEYFRAIGRERIEKEFPYFYVYPFSLM